MDDPSHLLRLSSSELAAVHDLPRHVRPPPAPRPSMPPGSRSSPALDDSRSARAKRRPRRGHTRSLRHATPTFAKLLRFPFEEARTAMPSTYRKTPEAVAALTPEQYPRHPEKRHRGARHRRAARQQGARHLRRHRLGRAAVRLLRQVRVRLRLAELHQADRAGERQRAARQLARHDPHRGALDARRQPSRPRLQRRAARSRRPALLHQLGVAALRPSRRHGRRRATAPTSTRWRT